MSWKLRDYLEQVRDAIEYKEGATLASLLSITAADNRQRIAQAFRANPRVRNDFFLVMSLLVELGPARRSLCGIWAL